MEAAIDGVTLLNVDCCSVDADLSGDGEIGVTDLLGLLAAWGACPALPAPCPADFNSDGQVNVVDLLQMFADWGVCP